MPSSLPQYFSILVLKFFGTRFEVLSLIVGIKLDYVSCKNSFSLSYRLEALEERGEAAAHVAAGQHLQRGGHRESHFYCFTLKN